MVPMRFLSAELRRRGRAERRAEEGGAATALRALVLLLVAARAPR